MEDTTETSPEEAQEQQEQPEAFPDAEASLEVEQGQGQPQEQQQQAGQGRGVLPDEFTQQISMMAQTLAESMLKRSQESARQAAETNREAREKLDSLKKGAQAAAALLDRVTKEYDKMVGAFQDAIIECAKVRGMEIGEQVGQTIAKEIKGDISRLPEEIASKTQACLEPLKKEIEKMMGEARELIKKGEEARQATERHTLKKVMLYGAFGTVIMFLGCLLIVFG
ncbi:MAG: hypothetical protein LBU11_01145 [Zoogloeaceae bacterium]|jgi:SMC interacting uncharacterized protein involved in chromosome segregation|nr:hypothetical protein [Zoogloeaceae bacterium]